VLGALRSFEVLLRLRGKQLQPVPTSAPAIPNRPAGPRRATQEELPMRRAVLQVLRDAHGEPLRVEEILERAQGLGAATRSKNPVNTIDLQLYGLRDRDKLSVQKVGPRSWRWAGGDTGESGTEINNQSPNTPMEEVTPRLGTKWAAKGVVTMRAAIVQVLRDAGGVPLHAGEIYMRAQQLGATSDAASPANAVDAIARSIRERQPIMNVGPRLWRWIGDEGDQSTYAQPPDVGAPALFDELPAGTATQPEATVKGDDQVD